MENYIRELEQFLFQKLKIEKKLKQNHIGQT